MSKAGSLLVAIIVLHVAPIFCTRWICAEAQNLQQSGRPAKPTAAQEDAGTKAFKAGVKFQEQKQYAQALVEYRKASALLPDDPSILWNAGMCAYFTKVYPYALTA